MNKLSEQFVPYDESVELRLLGFRDECFAYYAEINGGEIELIEKYTTEPCLMRNHVIYAPTFEQIKDWFRENHKIEIYNILSKKGYFIIISFIDNQSNFNDIEPEGYQKDIKISQLEAIREAIKLIKK